MFSSFLWIFIFPMILMSPMFTMSMNSWFSIWMSLEFNLMAFIPLIIFFNKFYKELSMKYFIIQSISSSILIFSSNLNMIMTHNNNNFMNLINMLINLSLLIKIGAAPFHFWFINMMNNLNWMNCLILSTWQKISPMIIIMYNFNKNLMFFSIITSSILSNLYGLNHQSIRLIFSYSSINHMSWMLFNMMISEMMWIIYFISYIFLNMSIMLSLFKMNILYLNQLFIINNNKFIKYLMLFNFFSISGLPPMFGFLMKWMSLNYLTWKTNFLILLMLMILSMLSFTFYMRICFSFLLNFYSNNKISIINKMFNFNNIKILNCFMMLLFSNLWIFNIWLMN